MNFLKAVFICLSLIIIKTEPILGSSINKNNLKPYPETLISNENLDKFYILDVPYCKTSFCKVYIINNKTLNIRSITNFRLNKYFKFSDANLSSSFVRNNFNGMNLFIPKIKKVNLDFEKVNILTSNDIKNKESKNDDLEYISRGIYVEEIDSDVLDYPKDPKAKSGYYNNRDIWINY